MTSITTINSTDLITNSRADINNNFTNLNSGKIETSVIDTDTTLAANSDTKLASQKAVKAYVDSGGNQNASTTAKGIVQEATDAQVVAQTVVGSSGARLFVNPGSVAAFGANKIIRSNSSGLLDTSLISIPTPSIEQIIPYVSSATTAFSTTAIIGSNNTGTVMYLGYFNSGTLAITIFRLAKDATSNQWYITHTTTFACGGVGSSIGGFTVIGSNMYMSFSNNGTLSIERYLAADLTSPTAITISGTARLGALFTDGTDLYIAYTTNTAARFTISGTTATNAADRTFTGMTNTNAIASDGTSIWQPTVSTGGNLAIKKFTIASGTLVSTSSTIYSFWDIYPNTNVIGAINSGTSTLGLGFTHTIESNTAVRGSALKLSAIATT